MSIIDTPIIDLVPTTRTTPPEGPPSPPDTLTRCMILEMARARFSDGRGPAVGYVANDKQRDSSACAYRQAETGTPCVVGAMLTDDEYHPLMEGRGVWELHSRGWLPERLKPHVELLVKLQQIHDSGCFWTADRATLNPHGWDEFEKLVKLHGCG